MNPRNGPRVPPAKGPRRPNVPHQQQAIPPHMIDALRRRLEEIRPLGLNLMLDTTDQKNGAVFSVVFMEDVTDKPGGYLKPHIPLTDRIPHASQAHAWLDGYLRGMDDGFNRGEAKSRPKAVIVLRFTGSMYHAFWHDRLADKLNRVEIPENPGMTNPGLLILALQKKFGDDFQLKFENAQPQPNQK